MPVRSAPDAAAPAPAAASPAAAARVTGWGRTSPTTARVLRPASYEEAVAAVRGSGPRGVVPRGLGRAYGDAAQNAGGTVLDLTALDRIHEIDAVNGLVVCDAGVSLHRLIQVLLPLGWFVPVTPGTRYVTVGGAIAADVHGKDHPVSGSFSRHVRAVELLTGDGETRLVTPEDEPELFWATAGGMGLTGVVLAATIELLPVQTSLMRVDTERAADLDDLMARLTASGHRHRYCVAWIDLLARGARTGRAVLTRGDHAPLDALERPAGGEPWARAARLAAARRDPLAFRPLRLPAAPRGMPGGLMGRTTVGLLNELWYRRAARERRGQLQRLTAFFHPLDGLPEWNRVYGPGGLVQYQFVVGHGQEETLRAIVTRLAEHRCPSFLAVLKRLGDAGPGWLSFPAPGWTLALDVPAATPGLAALLDELDAEVAAAGGRVYLAKDSRLRPELLASMYPRLDEFRALRARYDPRGVLTSDLARRLAL
jgi:decaprenylphospho-beta-D-ribofuranose 2-oxidase